jgi:hypothetical protein
LPNIGHSSLRVTNESASLTFLARIPAASAIGSGNVNYCWVPRMQPLTKASKVRF